MMSVFGRCVSCAFPPQRAVPAVAICAVLVLLASGSPVRGQAVTGSGDSRSSADRRVILITGSTDGLGREVARSTRRH